MVGDFDGRWPSSCKMHFRARISSVWLDLEMRAENVGDSPLPIAIGWHPYFLMPGSQRAQWRLRLPATHRLEVNNYKGMRPTGEKLPVHDTPWDFSSAQGRLLGNGSYDECYLEGLVGPGPGLDPTPRDIHLRDGSSGCDLLLRLHSPEINAVQLFSSPTDQSIAIEPQFNLPDPFNPVWQGASGMVSLAPGQSTAYRVSLSLRHAAASTEVQPPEGAL
jgi:aldose 1-epimerase